LRSGEYEAYKADSAFARLGYSTTWCWSATIQQARVCDRDVDALACSYEIIPSELVKEK
jgi:hypothetical protein